MYCRNKGLTKESIKAICRNDIPMFLNFIGSKPLAEVNHMDIEDFFVYCTEDRKNTIPTLGRKYTSLNSFFNTLIKQELLPITRNPLDKVAKPKIRRKIRPYLAVEEYQQLLSYVDSIKDLRGAALISLFFSSACRLTEIYQLNRQDLNYTGRRFKVLGKGQKERICLFSEDAASRIQAYIASRVDDLEPLFLSREHNRWSKKAIENYFAKVGIGAEIKKHCHPHLIRHTRAMALLRKDVPLEVIQRLLGHESIATTQVYAHMNVDDVQHKVDQFDIG
jgi:integrase/recombinase XerD